MQDLNKQKIFWHSRRGMLELDLLLVPFTEEVFDDLDLKEQMLYRDFLDNEDQDLFAWLMGSQAPLDARFQPLIARILAHKAQSN